MKTVAGIAWAEFLAARPVGVIATVDASSMPHAVPVEVVVDGEAVYVWCESGSAKARNAAREGRASLVAYKGNDGVLVRGAATLLRPDDDGYQRIADAFLKKYERTETYGNDCLIRISPDRVTVFG